MKIYEKILNLLDNIKKHPLKLVIAILFYVIFGQLWGGIAAIFLGTFVLFILFKLDSRVFIAFGLLFLISCPFYLLQRKELMAEEMAVYAYYSLFLGVMLQLIEYIQENNAGRLKNLFLRALKKSMKQ